MSKLERAYHLHNLGFSILPVRTKRPVLRWRDLQTYRLDPGNFDYWFAKQRCDVAVITGKLSGVVAIDCDSEEAATLVAECHTSSPIQQRTPRGRHYLYRWPGARTANRQKIDGEDIDIRGDGGYIVAYRDSENWTKKNLLLAPQFVLPSYIGSVCNV